MAAKQIELALSLSSALAKRGYTVVNSFDTSTTPDAPWPVISVGTMTPGQQGALIRVKPVDSIGKDSIGNTQRSFGPMVIQLGLESSSIAGRAELTEANTLAILGEIIGRGTRVELYLTADGDSPDIADLDDSSLLVAVWNGFNLDFGLMSAV